VVLITFPGAFFLLKKQGQKGKEKREKGRKGTETRKVTKPFGGQEIRE